MSQRIARHGDLLVGGSTPSTIIATAIKTQVNGIKVARIGDRTTNHLHFLVPCYGILVEGSATVKAEGEGICRVGDHTVCYNALTHTPTIFQCVISDGSPDTKAGG